MYSIAHILFFVRNLTLIFLSSIIRLTSDVKRFLKCGTKGGKMYHIKNDRRAIRTSQMLYDALVVLMGQKKFEKIKVSDLIKEAGVGRATFYRHFDTIEDILRMRSDQTIDDLLTYLIIYRQTHNIKNRWGLLKPFLRYFYLDSTIVELLIQAERVHILQASFYKRIEPIKQVAVGLLDAPPEYIEYGMVIRVGVAISILTQWIKSGKPQAPDELADELSSLAKRMIKIDKFL